MSSAAAFFDIDGTLYREGFIADLFRMLVKCEVIPYDKWYDEVRPEFINWDRRLGTYDTYLLKMASLYTEAITGHHHSLVKHIVDRVIEDKAMRTYVYTRARIQWHKDQGHKVITISGSPEELVGAMARFYELDDFRGSRYLINEEGIYTGEILPMWDAKSKRKAVMEMVQLHDLDLEQSWSYGDTAGDLTMFSLTGHPTLINPTRELIDLVRADKALMDRAKLIVERKDVIYKMDVHHLALEDD
ncbi:Phosphoserine phosphatase [Clostridiaceae bacterium JG1575]|nr:Phosphoserine phosphatase [Clostridiaceae bacterium JG1575]